MNNMLFLLPREQFPKSRALGTSDLLIFELHPKGERSETGATAAIPAADAAEAILTEVAEVDEAASALPGSGPNPIVVLENPLARALELGKDQSRQEGSITEARQVVHRQIINTTDVGQDDELLILVLVAGP